MSHYFLARVLIFTLANLGKYILKGSITVLFSCCGGALINDLLNFNYSDEYAHFSFLLCCHVKTPAKPCTSPEELIIAQPQGGNMLLEPLGLQQIFFSSTYSPLPSPYCFHSSTSCQLKPKSCSSFCSSQSHCSVPLLHCDSVCGCVCTYKIATCK